MKSAMLISGRGCITGFQLVPGFFFFFESGEKRPGRLPGLISPVIAVFLGSVN